MVYDECGMVCVCCCDMLALDLSVCDVCGLLRVNWRVLTVECGVVICMC